MRYRGNLDVVSGTRSTAFDAFKVGKDDIGSQYMDQLGGDLRKFMQIWRGNVVNKKKRDAGRG